LFDRFHRFARVARQVTRDGDLDAVVVIAGLRVFADDTFAGEPKGLAALRAGGDAGAHDVVNRRNVDLGSANRFADRDGEIDVNIVAAALEERMRPDMNQKIEIARRTAPRAGRAFAANPHPLSVAHAFRHFHFHRIGRPFDSGAATDGADFAVQRAAAAATAAFAIAAERHLERRAANGIGEIDRGLRLDVGAALRLLVDSAAEQIAEDVREIHSAAARTRGATRRGPSSAAAGELAE